MEALIITLMTMSLLAVSLSAAILYKLGLQPMDRKLTYYGIRMFGLFLLLISLLSWVW